MKKTILLFAGCFTLSIVFAQSAKTYAITSQGANDYYWASIREIDIASGQVTKTLFESDKTAYTTYDALSKTALHTSQKNFSINALDKPFAYGVAAVALDARHNRLYFSPMHQAQIRYVDLSSTEAKFYHLQLPLLTATNGGFLTEENHITRMVLINKVGYAITNNGNHMYQFTTGKKPTVTDMGGLIDDVSNGAISVHNKCSSWGGDLVAAEDGKLYLITANKHVFSIDVASRIAKHLGSITGVPAQFTTNGAVVNDAGKIVLTSSNPAAGFYEMDVKTLVATQIKNTASNFSISDLANANLVAVEKNNSNNNPQLEKQIIANDKISIYPNPITTSQFKLNLEEMATGNYAVVVTDLMGRQLYNQKIVVQNESQVETINMGKKPANGIYLVKVADASGKSVFVNKLVVE
jgi:hypothetical protein